MNYWLVVTSPDNFRLDRDVLNFKTQGLPYRYRKQVQQMAVGDKVAYYIRGLQRFGAIAKITGDYFEDNSKIWADETEMWPARRCSELELALQEDELLDAKKLVSSLSFIGKKDNWGVYLQGSLKKIPEDDFRLIESEMKKVIGDRQLSAITEIECVDKPEDQFIEDIMCLPLQSSTLHDRLGEMLDQIATWLDYNTQTKHKITPDHAYELDVAWLRGKNPEIAIEIQISGNLTEAKDRLAQARKFNYRKVVLVIKMDQMSRLNSLMRHELDLKCWMEAWSIGAIYDMYKSGQQFNHYYKRLIAATYTEKTSLDLVR